MRTITYKVMYNYYDYVLRIMCMHYGLETLRHYDYDRRLRFSSSTFSKKRNEGRGQCERLSRSQHLLT